MPFDIHGQWISVEQAERELEQRLAAKPEPVAQSPVDRMNEEIRRFYKDVRSGRSDESAFDLTVDAFSFRGAVRALPELSARAKYLSTRITPRRPKGV